MVNDRFQATNLAATVQRLARPPESIKPCHIFMIFYTVALVSDFDNKFFSAILILTLSAWVFISLNRESFLTLLFVTTAYFVIREIPDTENHTNFMVLSNIALILCGLYSYRAPDQGIEELFFDIAQPVARIMIIIAFAAAGFHKFNSDFINPEVSCIAIFVQSITDVAANSDFLGLGVPPFVFLIVIGMVVAGMLWRERAELRWPSIDWAAIGSVMLVMSTMAVVLAVVAGDVHTYSALEFLTFVVAVAIVCWQLIEAPLLLIRRFQWVALTFSLVVHVQLALLRIVDFQAIAIALLVAFVPPNVWQGWDRQAYASIGPFRLHRARLYYLLNLLGAFIMLAQTIGWIDWPRPLTAWGVLFIIGLLVMLWPIIRDLFSPDRTWRWEGVAVFNGVTPVWLYALPVCLLVFALTSHLGLRTAGNLSMYSNLRTEAGQNNHLLLGDDPLKWFGYQEDVVHIVDIGDEATIRRYLNRWGELEGHLVPVVEFRKLLWEWRQNEDVVPMTVEYGGDVTHSPNIAENPKWKVEGWDWEMRLMDFRVIQPNGPNGCRW